MSENEFQSIKKIQNIFFKNIDDKFKKFEEINHASKSSFNQDQATCKHLHEAMGKELKNALILKLSDIKSGGDSITEQITEDLKRQLQQEAFEASDDKDDATKKSEQEKEKYFQSYLKFNIAQITARQSSAANTNNQSQATGKNSDSTTNNDSANFSTSGSKSNMNFLHQQQQQELENNKFLIFGLFFLNSNSKIYDFSSSSSSSSPSNSSLVFFLFNTMPENIKDSLINNSANTYLIRKPLFTSQKIFSKNQTWVF